MENTSSNIHSQATGFFAEFKAFAMQGSVVDLAVGIVIGTAFNAIVTSLVNDVVMQAIAWAFGKPDFSAFVIGPIKIGNFITSVVNFLIIALTVFLVLKFLMRKDMKPKEKIA